MKLIGITILPAAFEQLCKGAEFLDIEAQSVAQLELDDLFTVSPNTAGAQEFILKLELRAIERHDGKATRIHLNAARELVSRSASRPSPNAKVTEIFPDDPEKD